jgi:tripartite-type tricarboxylate transporter receptor subunit TctC
MRFVIQVCAAWALALVAGAASAQTNWPERPVHLLVGFTAGSGTDVTARLLAQKFS